MSNNPKQVKIGEATASEVGTKIDVTEMDIRQSFRFNPGGNDMIKNSTNVRIDSLYWTLSDYYLAHDGYLEVLGYVMVLYQNVERLTNRVMYTHYDANLEDINVAADKFDIMRMLDLSFEDVTGILDSLKVAGIMREFDGNLYLNPLYGHKGKKVDYWTIALFVPISFDLPYALKVKDRKELLHRFPELSEYFKAVA